MELVDVTVPVRPGMPVFEGDPPVHVERVASLEAGDVATLSRLDLGAHTGTHVDAPAHFLPGGAGVEALPLDALVGPAVVVDARGAGAPVDARALAALDLPDGAQRVLLRTRGSELWDLPSFSRDFVGLTVDAAEALVARGVRLVGVDYLSVAPFGDPAPTHRTLLGAGVVVLEGLDLRAAAPGGWELLCLPLLVPGADGAPARVVLRR